MLSSYATHKIPTSAAFSIYRWILSMLGSRLLSPTHRFCFCNFHCCFLLPATTPLQKLFNKLKFLKPVSPKKPPSSTWQLHWLLVSIIGSLVCLYDKNHQALDNRYLRPLGWVFHWLTFYYSFGSPGSVFPAIWSNTPLDQWAALHVYFTKWI